MNGASRRRTVLKIVATAPDIALISQPLFLLFAFAVVIAAVNNAAKNKAKHILLKGKPSFILLFWLKQPGEAQCHASVENVTLPLATGGTARGPAGQPKPKKPTLNASLSTLTFSASHSQLLDLFSFRHESHTLCPWRRGHTRTDAHIVLMRALPVFLRRKI